MKTGPNYKRIVGIEKVLGIPEARLLNLECGHCSLIMNAPGPIPEPVYCDICAKENRARKRSTIAGSSPEEPPPGEKP